MVYLCVLVDGLPIVFIHTYFYNGSLVGKYILDIPYLIVDVMVIAILNNWGRNLVWQLFVDRVFFSSKKSPTPLSGGRLGGVIG